MLFGNMDGNYSKTIFEAVHCFSLLQSRKCLILQYFRADCLLSKVLICHLSGNVKLSMCFTGHTGDLWRKVLCLGIWEYETTTNNLTELSRLRGKNRENAVILCVQFYRNLLYIRFTLFFTKTSVKYAYFPVFKLST